MMLKGDKVTAEVNGRVFECVVTAYDTAAGIVHTTCKGTHGGLEHLWFPNWQLTKAEEPNWFVMVRGKSEAQRNILSETAGLVIKSEAERLVSEYSRNFPACEYKAFQWSQGAT